MPLRMKGATQLGRSSPWASPQAAIALRRRQQRRDDRRASARGDAGILQSKNAEHRRIACRPDWRRLRRRECFPQRHQPVALDPCQFHVAAMTGQAEADTVEQHFIAQLEVGMRGCLHRARQVDARDRREFAHHRRAPGSCQTVFVAHVRMQNCVFMWHFLVAIAANE